MIAVFLSALIAVPLGMIIGHTGRGTFLIVTGVNALRALPTLGVLLLGVLLRVETPNAAVPIPVAKPATNEGALRLRWRGE